MSPLALPRNLLDAWVDELVAESTSAAMRGVLLQLKERPTFEQQWPNEYKPALIKGKARVLALESIRPGPTSMQQILKNRKEVYDWWQAIG